MGQRADQLIGGKYRLVRPLASGGMGSVWVARHVDLEVDVAVKLRSEGGLLGPKAERWFKREAQAAARLKSPHVVQIHDYGIDAGAPYIAMELLEGEDLSAHLEREQRLTLTRALELIRQAGKALAHAHRAGIVHRDIKPSNLFLARQGEEQIVKILDFGIAKQVASGQDEETTSAGWAVGSPGYMSPEQARGRAVDARSDFYSLSAVLYRMVTGVPPFTGSSSQDIMIKICTEPPPRPSGVAPDLPRAVDRFFERALARHPGDRFQTVEELLAAFEALSRPGADGGEEIARGRDSATEPLQAPVADMGRNAPISRRRLLASLAAAGILLPAAVWAALGLRAEAAQEADGAESARAAAREEPPQERAAIGAEPSRAPPVSDATAEPEPTGDAHVSDDTPTSRVRTPARRPKPAPATPPSSAPPQPDEPVSATAVDPVFGLPVTAPGAANR